MAGGAPAIVTKRAGGEAATRAARRQAQAHAPRPRRFAANAIWEEYPFASTVEGGRGATLTLSPGSIKSSHGAALKNFYRDAGVDVGDQFLVRVR
ncbi:NucA/NucB deoxyribonuclease domain-containing protein [Streptomyces drozdowiczii]|uniref:NucA/NucB deoxyribonuclease domain-containing protein n=1 Tax=Streptomyces drozdowiczii TaxID=202862 RepID=UPI00403FE226